jgi:hypothetical protein
MDHEPAEPVTRGGDSLDLLSIGQNAALGCTVKMACHRTHLQETKGWLAQQPADRFESAASG